MKLGDFLKVLSGTYELSTYNMNSKEININIQNVMEYIDKELDDIRVSVNVNDKTTRIKLSFKRDLE